MGYLIDKRDNLETDLQDIIDKINYFSNSCSKWRDGLCDTYNNDDSWWDSASDWLKNEVKVTIEWLDHFMDWAEHFTLSLQKIYDAISRVYDSYDEEELNSTPEINNYLDKAYKRCNIAYDWYNAALKAYENFDKVLSGEYDVESVERIIHIDNQLFNDITHKEEEYDDNADRFWKEK